MTEAALKRQSPEPTMNSETSSQAKDRLRPVTSRQNALVKELRRAFTQAELTPDGYCAVEGIRILEEAIRSGLRVKAVFFSESAANATAKLLPQISSHAETLLLPSEVFNSAVNTETPQGVAALVRLKEHTLDDLFREETPLLICVAGIQDPGNLGTIIRSAEAFGASGVISAERTVTWINPKVVRASAGSLFRLPVVKCETAKLLPVLREKGIRTAATSSHKGTPIDEVDFTQPTCIFIGSEGAGVSKEVLAAADETIAVPQSPKVESLNAGIAASIVLYEAARQRRTAAE
jgi:TrmH family RNA methyltransferase